MGLKAVAILVEGSGGVTTIDGISGAITLVEGSGITITDNSPSSGDITIAATGGGSIAVTKVTSFPYTATAASGLTIYNLYNSSGGAVTFNLPASPSSGEVAVVVDAGVNAGTYTQTINGNGNNIVAYGTGTNSSIGIASSGGSVSLAFDGTNWVQYA